MADQPAKTIRPGARLPERIVNLLRNEIPLGALDVAVVLAAYLVPLVLRFDGAVPTKYWRRFLAFMPVAAFLHVLTNYLFGLYGQMWRYASVQEARRVILAGLTACGLVLVAGLWLVGEPRRMPISVLVLGAILSLIGFGAIRFQSRLFAFRRQTAMHERIRVLLVGAGEGGAQVLRDILRNASLGLDPVGFVDDDPRKQGRSLHGVAVLGRLDSLPHLVAKLRPDQVLLAIPSAHNHLIQQVAELCEEGGVTLRVLPSVHEAVGGRITARDIRDLRIEDLLGRQQVETDLDAVRSILEGRRVMVTGAGGSIGSEIARQVVQYGPSALVLVDHDETHLHDLLTELDGAPGIEPVLSDVREPDRVLSLFLRTRPEVVFHAAAHKHVPILESHPEEALLTNVIGTANVADAAVATDVERFIFISSDKAVNPVSVMGASKWFAEQIVLSRQGMGLEFSAVRFGNVVGSRGSVIPTFFRQIARGGPVTVTDPGMARYFMSVHEAVQLVLQAAALSRGGEVFTLDMGDPVNILELAQRLIRLSGRVPGKDVEITVVGARPGEKLIEEVVDPDEAPVPSSHPDIVVSRPPLPDQRSMRRAIREMEALAEEGRSAELAGRIKELAHGTRELAATGGQP